MVAESFGAAKLGFRALEMATPDVFFDTVGFPFTYVAARILAGCKVAAYVHYPTISTVCAFARQPSRKTFKVDISLLTSLGYAEARLGAETNIQQ